MGIHISGLAHIGIFVKDLERSLTFYTEKLDFTCVFRYMNEGVTPVAFIQNGSCMIELVEKPDAKGRGDGVVDHVAFAVKDIEQAVEKLRAAGIETEEERITYCPECFAEGAKWILFRGPDGEHLEITERGPF